jgi:large conductance mechanosensitive channel
MKWWREFKQFVMTGDLVAVGVALVMALALTAVITSFVDNIIMPIIGILFGERSFDDLTWTINDSVITYGTFITAFVAFVAIAFSVFFLIVKPYRAYLDRKASGEEPEPEIVPEDIELLREIRDSLAKSN